MGYDQIMTEENTHYWQFIWQTPSQVTLIMIHTTMGHKSQQGVTINIVIPHCGETLMYFGQQQVRVDLGNIGNEHNL